LNAYLICVDAFQAKGAGLTTRRGGGVGWGCFGVGAGTAREKSLKNMSGRKGMVPGVGIAPEALIKISER